MLSRSVILAALALPFVLLLVGGAAVGEEASGDPALWAFDVRVVRVETTTAETVETPWTPTDGTTTKLPWSDLLAALKKRGVTTVLLDQRITGLTNRPVEAMQQRDQQIRQFQNADLHNERWQSSNLRSGVKAVLKPTSAWLEYQVVVNWMLRPREEDLRALLCTASWKGDHPGLEGDTLVLSYREQVEHLDGERRGVEIYAFVTGRRMR